MTQPTFEEWFIEHYIPHVRSIDEDVNIIHTLVFDGHRSHITLKIAEAALKYGITIVLLPPSCTHFLQPLDVAVFGAAKAFWARLVRKYGMHDASLPLSKTSFPYMLKELFDHMVSKSEAVRNGFMACGIYPLNREIILAKALQAKNCGSRVLGVPVQDPDVAAGTAVPTSSASSSASVLTRSSSTSGSDASSQEFAQEDVVLASPALSHLGIQQWTPTRKAMARAILHSINPPVTPEEELASATRKTRRRLVATECTECIKKFLLGLPVSEKYMYPSLYMINILECFKQK